MAVRVVIWWGAISKTEFGPDSEAGTGKGAKRFREGFRDAKHREAIRQCDRYASVAG